MKLGKAHFSKKYGKTMDSLKLSFEHNATFNNHFKHSHKKRKDSLKGSLDRVLLAAELEFPKILVPRLPQHTSNVNTECAGKSEWSKQLYSLYLTSFLEHCI